MTGRGDNVLVIGGTGFVGSYVVRALLDEGRRVCVFDVSGFSPEPTFVLGQHAEGAELELGSVEDRPRLFDVVRRRRPGQIVHLGGNVDALFLQTNPLTALRVNVQGTVNVLEVATLLEVERSVFFSSIGVLPAVQYEPIDAAHPVILPRQGPATGAYGASKLAGEAFCFAYEQGFGLDFRVIRPSATYGFGMRWHSANYIKQIVEPAVRGEPVRMPTGGSLPRDYTHVLDVASLTMAVLDAPDDTDRIFYGATGEPLVTAREVGRMVAELVPGAEIEIGDELTEEDRIETGFRARLSIQNAQEQLGWSPRFRSVREGIAEYIERYRAFLATASEP